MRGVKEPRGPGYLGKGLTIDDSTDNPEIRDFSPPRRTRDPWRNSKFSLLAEGSAAGGGGGGLEDSRERRRYRLPHAVVRGAILPPGPVLASEPEPDRSAQAQAPSSRDDLIQVLERSSGSTSSGTSDVSAESSSSSRSGLSRSVSEKVLIQDEDITSPSSTTDRDKRALLRRNLTQILSCVYAVFIVTLGVVVYISSLVAGKSPVLAEAFSLYLVVIGLVYLVILYSDIRRYLNQVKGCHSFLHYLATPNGESEAEVTAAPAGKTSATTSPGSSPMPMPVPHWYCFSDAGHAASFYLKVGAAGFCFGHLVHSSLLLAYQTLFLIQEPDEFYRCASVATLVLDVLYPVYSFFQLFFIFKYSNVIINRYEEFARFAVMHCLASSLCFWVWTILRETIDSLAHYEHDYHHDHNEGVMDYESDYPVPPGSSSVSDLSVSEQGPMALPLVTYHKRGALDLVRFINASTMGSAECHGATQLSTVLDSLSPYLYPFTIEYSILLVGVLFIIWHNIGLCQSSSSTQDRHRKSDKTNLSGSTTSGESAASLCRPPPMSPQNGFVSNVVLHADCHSANKGLFAGLIVLVGAAISIILFLLAMADSEYMEVGLTVNSVTELTLLVLMTVAALVAYCRLSGLDVRRRTASVTLLDHLLLFLCIPAFFLYAIFSIVPALEQRSYLSITAILLQVMQVLVQTPFIMDGMRRCSNGVTLRVQKPGRELLTFLIVCNVALWITDTFEIKSVDARDHRADYYGRVLWTMISHATVPLTMLYRFHSSGCLVHIWKAAYEPDTH